MLAAIFVLLDNLDTDLHIKKCVCKIVGNGSTTYNDTVFDLIGLETDLTEKCRCIKRRGQNGNHISVVYNVITTRNGYIVTAFNRADQNITSESI